MPRVYIILGLLLLAGFLLSFLPKEPGTIKPDPSRQTTQQENSSAKNTPQSETSPRRPSGDPDASTSDNDSLSKAAPTSTDERPNRETPSTGNQPLVKKSDRKASEVPRPNQSTRTPEKNIGTGSSKTASPTNDKTPLVSTTQPNIETRPADSKKPSTGGNTAAKPTKNYLAKELVVGSLNCEWFGDIEQKPRTEQQIRTFAKLLETVNADVMCIQEVSEDGDSNRNGKADWKELLNFLGKEWKGYLGDTGGGQKIGVLWKTDSVQMSDFGELNSIRREEIGPGVRTFPRIPFTCYVKTNEGALDFRLVVIHLFAFKAEARPEECRQLREWYQNYSKRFDEDVLMMGDFNTYELASGRSPELDVLEKDDLLTAVSRSHLEATQVKSHRRLDQAVLSRSLLETSYVPKSFDVLRELESAVSGGYADTISDHFPVILKLRIPEQDLDNRPSGDWGDDVKDPR